MSRGLAGVAVVDVFFAVAVLTEAAAAATSHALVGVAVVAPPAATFLQALKILQRGSCRKHHIKYCAMLPHASTWKINRYLFNGGSRSIEYSCKAMKDFFVDDRKLPAKLQRKFMQLRIEGI